MELEKLIIKLAGKNQFGGPNISAFAKKLGLRRETISGHVSGRLPISRSSATVYRLLEIGGRKLYEKL